MQWFVNLCRFLLRSIYPQLSGVDTLPLCASVVPFLRPTSWRFGIDLSPLLSPFFMMLPAVFFLALHGSFSSMLLPQWVLYFDGVLVPPRCRRTSEARPIRFCGHEGNLGTEFFLIEPPNFFFCSRGKRDKHGVLLFFPQPSSFYLKPHQGGPYFFAAQLFLIESYYQFCKRSLPPFSLFFFFP